MKIALHPAVGLNEVGQRQNNEDSVFPALASQKDNTPITIFMVCDGVGGNAKGEVASALACSIIPSYLSGFSELDSIIIQQALEKTEHHFSEYVEAHPDSKGMATTMTFFAIDKNGILLAHIGDSRIYQVRNGQIVHKTKDHSFVNEMLEAKIITEEEAVNHPKKNVITRVLGIQKPTADVCRVKNVMVGDYFLLCTDGVLEGISEAELLLLLSRKDMTNQQKIECIKEACLRGAKDNFSAYLLQIKDIEKSLFENIQQLYHQVTENIN